jgi:hypothetical protein
VARRRIRSLKPEFFGDEKVISLTRDSRYTMIGFISLADDRGRLRDRSLEILGAIYPEEKVSVPQLRKWTVPIINGGLALRYEVDGHSYLWLPRFLRHQVVDKPTESELPPHPEDDFAEVPIIEAYRLAKGREKSTNSRGKLSDKSQRTSRDVDESSRPTRASFPVLPSSTPIAPTTGDASASDFGATIEVCKILNDSGLWGDLVSPGAVESVGAEFPDVDLVNAGHLANTWASDSTWAIRSAPASLRAAAKKLEEERIASEGKGDRDRRRKRGADALRKAMAEGAAA